MSMLTVQRILEAYQNTGIRPGKWSMHCCAIGTLAQDLDPGFGPPQWNQLELEPFAKVLDVPLPALRAVAYGFDTWPRPIPLDEPDQAFWQMGWDLAQSVFEGRTVNLERERLDDDYWSDWYPADLHMDEMLCSEHGHLVGLPPDEPDAASSAVLNLRPLDPRDPEWIKVTLPLASMDRVRLNNHPIPYGDHPIPYGVGWYSGPVRRAIERLGWGSLSTFWIKVTK